ncbi:OmpA family protein [Marinilabiliaceae bacterium ANBcel2]|nr:OmpA family protein [Marinilabiliaceae bacterium ANBcel2]
MRRFILAALFFIFAFSLLQGQIDFSSLEEEQIYNPDSTYNRWSVTVGYGPVIYYTDVIDYTVFPSSDLKFAPTLQIARQFGRSWAVEGQFLMADMYGQKYERYFEGSFREATINLKGGINQLISGGPLGDRWNIYGKIGIGAIFFRSVQREQGSDNLLTVGDIYSIPSGYPTSYSDWSSDDYLVMGYERRNADLQKKSRVSEVIIPYGLGVSYRINNRFDVGFEANMRNVAADNLDVDKTGADNDSYLQTSFSVTYKIGRRDRRHSSWTYKDFNLAYERERARDPLAYKIDSLRQEVQELASVRDSVVSDTTYVHTQEVIKREFYSATIFFGFDRSDIDARGQKSLAAVARFMLGNPEARMVIQGYTDERGPDQYNYKLSERRCMAVRDALVNDFGISSSRFDVEPKGESELLSDTKALAPRGIHLVNRRVDIIYITD